MKQLTIKRNFSASIDRIWQAFTTKEDLNQWFSPTGMTTKGIQVNLEVGKKLLYCFVSEDKKEFWGCGKYQEITAPADKKAKISYLDSFCDEKGNLVPGSHYGIPGDEIMETLVEFFFSEQNGKTELKMVGDNPYDDSMEEMMLEGWNGMFDKLEKLVSSNP